jgi:hypothetical protein
MNNEFETLYFHNYGTVETPPLTISLTVNNLRIEWVNLGEGRNGDYNSFDPDDQNMLRFSVYVVRSNGALEEPQDSSYCTNVPASTPLLALEYLLVSMLNQIINKVGSTFSDDITPDISDICENLSWVEGIE